MDLIRQCVRFHEMLSAFIRRELRQRYVGSVMGRAWPFLQPLLILGTYYVVFVQLLEIHLVDERYEGYLRENLPRGYEAYQPLLMACGLIPWLVSAEFVVRVTNSIIENGSLVKKIAFPSELLPVYLLGSYVVNLLIMVGIFVVLTWALTGLWPPLIWLFPMILITHTLFLLGIGYFLSAANVFIRDLKDLVPIIVNLWFFLTPIFYLKNMVGEDKQWLYTMNPVAYLIDLYRWAFIMPEPLRKEIVGGQPVSIGLDRIWETLGIFAAVAVVFFVLGYRFFMANRHKFADEI